MENIIIKGAREHNLKNINLEIPRNKLVIMTGISGSGKSSLAFDTIYAEGQRRYVESLSAYARQFLGQMEKPDVDYIEGLSPAISIDQKSTIHNPRSTVGTVTEIYDYLRLLYARIGIPHCYKCGKKIERQTPQQIIDQILKFSEGTKFQILAPVVRGKKGEYKQLLNGIKKEGYVRVRVDGKVYQIDDEIKMDRYVIHNIEVVVDRLIMKKGIERRLADSVETALKLGNGIVIVDIGNGEEIVLSEHFACMDCEISYEELTPRMFSFNSPYGACPVCGGLGNKREISPDLVVVNSELSLNEGAFNFPGGGVGTYFWQNFYELSKKYDFSLSVPYKDLSRGIKDLLLYGTRDKVISFKVTDPQGRTRTYTSSYEGVIPMLNRRYRETDSDYARARYEDLMEIRPCPECKGARLKPEVLAVTLEKKNIYQLCQLSVKEEFEFLSNLKLTQKEKLISERIIKELKTRLKFLVDVGLDYLTLSRAAGTLSGGEAQRIRLATQIGSGLVGVLYILDEPSIGLHQKDNRKLVDMLKRLCDLGNSVIVVEHDEETILNGDFIVDIGPGAGEHGGKIVAKGSLEDILASEESITGKYLSGKRSIGVPAKRRKPNEKFLKVVKVSEHNLKNINVRIPLGLFVCVTGVSGSGKSTLVTDVLSKALAAELYGSKERPGKYERIEGLEYIDKVIEINQSPIGRTPRSNPATYIKVFDDIRNLFAQTQESKIRGYAPGRFSFNVRGGRCEVCQGDGTIKIEMHFLPDVYIICDTCKGKRYNRETLEVNFKGKNISDILNMSVEEALRFFENIPKIKRKLQTLYDVGLGYIKLGQSAPTLSGGEAQRVKLSAELSKRETGKTFYILDEPTTGLHFADIEKLLDVLDRLVEGGNTILVIEHNLDVIKRADYIIDLGPDGGDEGGQIVGVGSPEDLIKNKNSYTGQYLKKVLLRRSSTAPSSLKKRGIRTPLNKGG
ncbi:MAG: excinuclease ABC subunit UvrA [Actinobacteria bacterium]|nr:excinuclease ABC subunit UvrA [Actinomycetota bacterium]